MGSGRIQRGWESADPGRPRPDRETALHAAFDVGPEACATGAAGDATCWLEADGPLFPRARAPGAGRPAEPLSRALPLTRLVPDGFSPRPRAAERVPPGKEAWTRTSSEGRLRRRRPVGRGHEAPSAAVHGGRGRAVRVAAPKRRSGRSPPIRAVRRTPPCARRSASRRKNARSNPCPGTGVEARRACRAAGPVRTHPAPTLPTRSGDAPGHRGPHVPSATGRHRHTLRPAAEKPVTGCGRARRDARSAQAPGADRPRAHGRTTTWAA